MQVLAGRAVQLSSRTMRYSLNCRACRGPVTVSRKRFAELFDADKKPLCLGCRRMGRAVVDWQAIDERIGYDDNQRSAGETENDGVQGG